MAKKKRRRSGLGAARAMTTGQAEHRTKLAYCKSIHMRPKAVAKCVRTLNEADKTSIDAWVGARRKAYGDRA